MSCTTKSHSGDIPAVFCAKKLHQPNKTHSSLITRFIQNWLMATKSRLKSRYSASDQNPCMFLSPTRTAGLDSKCHEHPFKHAFCTHGLCSIYRRHWDSSRYVMHAVCTKISHPKHIKFTMLALINCTEHVQYQQQSQVAQCPCLCSCLGLQRRNTQVPWKCFCSRLPPAPSIYNSHVHY